MCVILNCIDKKPDKSLIEKCYDDSSDGAGLAFFNNDGVAEYKKGLFRHEIEKVVNDTPLPFILHFRAASWKMGRSYLLTHPFIVSETSPTSSSGKGDKLLFHNGTYVDYKVMMIAAGIDKTKVKDEITDTRGIAMILSKLGDDQQIELLKSIPGKFVLMDSNKKQFFTFGEFKEEKDYPGIQFSNLDWKTITVTHYHGRGDDNEYEVGFPGFRGTKVSSPAHSTEVKAKETTEENKDLPPQQTSLILKSNTITDLVKCRYCGFKIPDLRVTLLRRKGINDIHMDCYTCEAKHAGVIKPPPKLTNLVSPIIGGKFMETNCSYAG